MVDAVTAKSTLGAVLVALFAPASRSCWKRAYRPRLELRFGDVEPLKSFESGVPPTAVRVEIVNVGRPKPEGSARVPRSTGGLQIQSCRRFNAGCDGSLIRTDAPATQPIASGFDARDGVFR
jgi:hypothetical protein